MAEWNENQATEQGSENQESEKEYPLTVDELVNWWLKSEINKYIEDKIEYEELETYWWRLYFANRLAEARKNVGEDVLTKLKNFLIKKEKEKVVTESTNLQIQIVKKPKVKKYEAEPPEKEKVTNNENNKENEKKYKKAISLIWQNEVDFFYDFFGLWNEENPDLFVEQVEKIQGQWWDWILWEVTLEKIYKEHYIKNESKIENPLILKRIKIFKEMEWYKSKPKALYWKLKVFNKSIFMWVWENREWNYINPELEKLVGKNFSESLSSKENLIIFKNINWKSIMAFYEKWELDLIDYVSPWITSKPTPLVNWKRKNRLLSKLKYSASYPIEKDKNWKIISVWWWVMPYGINVDRRVWIHWTSSRTPKWDRDSNWCIRVSWLYYAEHLFERVKELWINNVRIDTRHIYW